MINVLLVREGLRQFVEATNLLFEEGRLSRLFAYFMNQVCAILL